MKILILSNTPWSTDNSFGNSFSCIFEGIQSLEFANIYCRVGYPKNNINGKYFQITEQSLLGNLLNRKSPSGTKVLKEYLYTGISSKPKFLKHAQKSRLQIYFWMRDLIWKIGRWKSYELKVFVDDFKPDIIFQPLYYSNHLNKIVLCLKEYTKVPMVCYVSDDVYTLRQFNLSPLYWIDRFIKRRIIKKVVDQCDYMYVISEVQKKEYEKCFGKECRILTKGADFSIPTFFKENFEFPFKFVYTGNIGAGRWKSLARLGGALKEVNRNKLIAQLHIYTTTPLTTRMKTALNIEGSIIFKGSVPSEKIHGIHSDADILVHVEPTDLKGRLLVRHSFSTKLVDYFHAGRAVFAVGPLGIASIEYIKDNSVGILATNDSEILARIQEIATNPLILTEYARKAWEFGKLNHQIKDIQDRLYNDLSSLIRDENSPN